MVKVKTLLIRQHEEEMLVGKAHCSYITLEMRILTLWLPPLRTLHWITSGHLPPKLKSGQWLMR